MYAHRFVSWYSSKINFNFILSSWPKFIRFISSKFFGFFFLSSSVPPFDFFLFYSIDFYFNKLFHSGCSIMFFLFLFCIWSTCAFYFPSNITRKLNIPKTKREKKKTVKKSCQTQTIFRQKKNFFYLNYVSNRNKLDSCKTRLWMVNSSHKIFPIATLTLICFYFFLVFSRFL